MQDFICERIINCCNLLWPHILKTIGTLLVFYFFIQIGRLFILENKINELYKEKELKISEKNGQGRGIIVDIIKGQQNKIEEEYGKKIEKLERERRFILEKLPFLKS